MGIICQIYKQKGSEQDPGNYFDITLLSSLGKLFTSCINTRLAYDVEYNNLMIETQAGFRSTYSNTYHIFLFFLKEDFIDKKSDKKIQFLTTKT